jgi:hypothetical protein
MAQETALGPVVVSGPAAGIPGDRCQAGMGGEPPCVTVSGQVTDDGDELAPRIGPMPDIDSMISARSSPPNASRISRSLSLLRLSRASSWWARSQTSLAARFSPGSATVWDCAASTA